MTSSALLRTATFSTPCGPFSIALDDTGALVATAFGLRPALLRRLPANCHATGASDRDPAVVAVKEQVDAYFAGKRRNFGLRMAPLGTPFQRRVWTALAEIPHGETRSYGQLAAQLGQPGAARAIGRANATNPLCLVVPCHRVIGADGSLTGFAFGETIKRQLLVHEGVAI
ncbi:MAG: methylated-DNA--[protein]-cysteine S-methyltransferase [Verrucomicrobia bacterium]|nr:methylated-DNA--[protein]-cysteine S-methyltransferase [Verrucomicrobiota bacterium]